MLDATSKMVLMFYSKRKTITNRERPLGLLDAYVPKASILSASAPRVRKRTSQKSIVEPHLNRRRQQRSELILIHSE